MSSDFRPRVLYVGGLGPFSTCLHRLRALEELGCHVAAIDSAADTGRSHWWSRQSQRFVYRVRLYGLANLRHFDLAATNKSILEKMQQSEFDVLWLDNGVTVRSETLGRVKSLHPNCLVVGYSGDDIMARHNNSRQFLEHVSQYDCFFTTKSFNVDELKSLGCPRVYFVGNGFDEKTHRVMPLSKDARQRLGGPVGFIGTFERARARSIGFLANHDIPVRIWGQRWRRLRNPAAKARIEYRELFGDDYATAITNSDINLCFLRKMNRDLHTSRSVEIPACGGFLIAERTDEHCELFEEGREAEFFDSDEELLDKVRYYLRNSDKRRKIAAAGRERCVKGGYSNIDRLREMLSALGLVEDWQLSARPNRTEL